MEIKTEIMVTDGAKAYLKNVMGGKDALRLSIVGGMGCGGNEYDITPIEEVDPSDDYIELGDGARLYVDAADMLKLFGTRIDFIEDDLGNRRLDIINPNEKGACGCGKSVTF